MTISDMTVEEFKQHLKKMRERNLDIPKKGIGQAIPVKNNVRKIRSDRATHRAYFKKGA